jgi:hypothetical protein
MNTALGNSVEADNQNEDQAVNVIEFGLQGNPNLNLEHLLRATNHLKIA